MTGILAFVGGGELRSECTFEPQLFPPGCSVVLLPTALAYEDPDSSIAAARDRCRSLGASCEVLPVMTRPDAALQPYADVVAAATHVYVLGGSPMHLRAVLKGSLLLDALVGVWTDGATVAVAAESAAVLCSHMVDLRGGAFTVGLGLITTMTIIPRHDQWSPDKLHRTVSLAATGQVVVGIDEATALVRAPDGGFSVEGQGSVHVYDDGRVRGLDLLPAHLNPERGI